MRKLWQVLLTTIILVASPIVHRAQNAQSAAFIANKGQWSGPFSYKAQFGDLAVFAEPEGFSFVYQENLHKNHSVGGKQINVPGHEHPMPEFIRKHAFRLRFKGAGMADFQPVSEPLPGYYNYLIGNDRSKWRGHVPRYEKLQAQNVYPGIHMVLSSEAGEMKYDYMVTPGADPAQIAFTYTGAKDVVHRANRIMVRTSVGDLAESIPLSYQVIDGQQVPVKCLYSHEDGYFGFTFPEGYRTDLPLVIDPVLVAATLSGTAGTNSNFGHGAAFDFAGNIYTHAISFDSEYPTNEGSFQEAYGGGGTDAAISKFNPDGSELIFATFLGGSEGEHPHSTIANGNQEIYVFGTTSSANFPVSPNAFQTVSGGGADIFVTGLTADGSDIVGSTYLGGSSADGQNMIQFGGHDLYRGEINANVNGDIYLATCSSSSDFPTTENGFQPTKLAGQDGVVVKLNANLSELIFSTFIGSEGNDMAYGIRIKDDQSVVVSGAVGTFGQLDSIAEFPTVGGAYQPAYGGGMNDGFVCIFSEDGSELLRSTLLGLEDTDLARFVDLDSNDDVWIFMETQSQWPATPGVWGTGDDNVRVHKLNEDLSELLITSSLSTGTGSGTPVAFMVDLCNGIYTSMYSTFGFSASPDALFSEGGFYLGVYTADMTDLTYGTYYTESHVDGGTSRFDTQGIVYQGVCSGGMFNTTPNAFATNQTPGWDIGVFKIDFEIESVNAVAGAAGYLVGCAPHTVIFQNLSVGESYLWDFGDGNTSDEYLPTHVYDEPGEYLVSLVVSDPESCNLSDTVFIPITVFPEVVFNAEFTHTIDCETGEVQLTDLSEGPADIEYEWDMGDGTMLYDQNPAHTYENPGIYTIVLNLSSAACNQTMSFTQEVIYKPFTNAVAAPVVVDFCDSFTVEFVNNSQNASTFFWDLGDGATSESAEDFTHVYSASGTYEVLLVASDTGSCNLVDSLTFTFNIPEPPVLDPVITASQIGDCKDLEYSAEVNPNGPADTYTWFLNNEVVGNAQTLTNTAAAPGTYTLQVVVTDAVCNHEFSESVSLVLIDTLGVVLPQTLSLCYYDNSLQLNATVPFSEATYNWNNGVSTEPVLEVTQAGTYNVEVRFNGCRETGRTVVQGISAIPLFFEADICNNQPNTVQFEFTELVQNVAWNDGQEGFTVEVQTEGYYPFEAIDNFGCRQIDSLFARAYPEEPITEIPNVFTPNSDGRNDVFTIMGEPLESFHLMLYNRWGRLVFETTEIYGVWDGTLPSGEPVGEEVLMVVLRYRNICDTADRVYTGTLEVLR